MAEHDARVSPGMLREVEPRDAFLAGPPRRARGAHVEMHVGRQHAHARQAVDDEAQPPVALVVTRPVAGPVAVHLCEEGAELGALQNGLDLRGALQGLVHAPRGVRARMDHERIDVFGIVRERATPQPVDEFVDVGRPERFRQRVELAGHRERPLRQRQQMQVVIAEYGNCRVTEGLYESQGLERLRATVDEVAGQPQRILARVEIDGVEQPPERVVAALQVPDSVKRHGRRSAQFSTPGTASVNGAIGASKLMPLSVFMRYRPCIAPTGVSSTAPLE